MQIGSTETKVKRAAAQKGTGKKKSSGIANKQTLHLKEKPTTPRQPDADVTGMIATAAYFFAEQRHFEPGHELDDWLSAERHIRATLTGQ